MYASRNAILVLGPESSGTRLLTRFFIQAGYFGNGDHSQGLDHFADFRTAPESLVWRRSVPHKNKWPDIVGMYMMLRRANYAVHPLVAWRDPRYMVASQVRAGHAGNTDLAMERTLRAVQHIDTALDELGHTPLTVVYERFISSADLRKALFGIYSTATFVDIEVYDANKQYRVSDLPPTQSPGILRIWAAVRESGRINV